MKSLLILAVVVCAGYANPTLRQPGRIVGGESTVIENYPDLVQIDFRNAFSGRYSQSCGGNILTSRYVLTAAHCYPPYIEPIDRRVRAGATLRDLGGVHVDVVRTINHPSYGLNGLDGDITLIELRTALEWSPAIQPARIPTQGTQIPGGLPAVHAGWGDLWYHGLPPLDLQHVTVYTVDNDVCRQRYAGIPISTNMICAGLLDVGGADACQGDSGGPLYYENIVVGVVSFGIGCAEAYYPGVSTNVGSYTNWIVQNVN